MQLIETYLYKGLIYFCPSAQTTTGAWIGTGIVHTLSESASPESKASAIYDALNQSRRGVPHPTEFNGLGRALLKAAGVKSFTAFAKRAACCYVTREGEQISLTPNRRYGNKGAYTEISDKRITLKNPNPMDLGHALEECFRIAAEAEPQPDDETPSHT